jgi:hypothetical protein
MTTREALHQRVLPDNQARVGEHSFEDRISGWEDHEKRIIIMSETSWGTHQIRE